MKPPASSRYVIAKNRACSYVRRYGRSSAVEHGLTVLLLCACVHSDRIEHRCSIVQLAWDLNARILPQDAWHTPWQRQMWSQCTPQQRAGTECPRRNLRPFTNSAGVGQGHARIVNLRMHVTAHGIELSEFAPMMHVQRGWHALCVLKSTRTLATAHAQAPETDEPHPIPLAVPQN